MQKYSFDNIEKINGGSLYYFDDTHARQSVDLKQSGLLWWDKHYKRTFADVLFGKRQKNKYVGDRCRCFGEAYIRFYTAEGEIMFVLDMPENSDSAQYSECRERWCDVLNKLTENGFWLFDEA